MYDYDSDAYNFLKTTNTEITKTWIEYNYYFKGDKFKRDIYSIVLKITKGARVGESYTFKFGQSINNSSKFCRFKPKAPTDYDILACLTATDPNSFDEWCLMYGYSTDSISALKTYNGVCDEYSNLKRLYSDEHLELLSQIW